MARDAVRAIRRKLCELDLLDKVKVEEDFLPGFEDEVRLCYRDRRGRRATAMRFCHVCYDGERLISKGYDEGKFEYRGFGERNSRTFRIETILNAWKEGRNPSERS